MKDFDLDFVRSQFYAFDADNPLSQKAFFENAGGSFPCKFVVDKLTKFYETTKVQLHFCRFIKLCKFVNDELTWETPSSILKECLLGKRIICIEGIKLRSDKV